MLQSVIASFGFIWVLMAIVLVVESAPGDNVLDTDGNPLEINGQYIITASDPNSVGGGLSWVPRNPVQPCPLFVGEINLSPGIPVSFVPFEDRETEIKEDKDFRVVFFGPPPPCPPGSPQWAVHEARDPETGKRLITSGNEDNPNAYFRISMIDGQYNLVWCPLQVCPGCPLICSTVGAFTDSFGVKLLALDGAHPFPVMFKRTFL